MFGVLFTIIFSNTFLITFCGIYKNICINMSCLEMVTYKAGSTVLAEVMKA